MSKSNIKILTIKELCNGDHYIVPIYQRNYAWDDKEIRELIQDINSAMQRNKDANYYLGSLVVYRRDDGNFEVIDGQQRLTTLNILLACLEHNDRIKLSFEHRRAADESLEKLTEVPNITSLDKNDSIQNGYIIAKNILQDHGEKIDRENFKDFLLKQVKIIRTEVPPNTNLNHYFEIMNNRGEQLEKHEILKTRLMDKLDNSSHHTFAKIWDACSDMQRYTIMSIKPEIREKIFGEDWVIIPKDFEKIKEMYNDNIDSDNNHTENKLNNITSPDYENREIITKDSHDSALYDSVIDFPNFLLCVYRIYIEHHSDGIEKAPPDQIEVNIKATSLDDKNLLDDFKHLYAVKNKDNKNQVKEFIIVLLQCRLLFDKYVIKGSPLKDTEWVLRQVQPQNNTSDYSNTFKKSEDSKLSSNKILIMIESMFHVSSPSKNNKNWLYATLRWLFIEYSKYSDINAEKFIDFLHNLCEKFYFGRYGEKQHEFIDLILSSEDIDFSPIEGDIWQRGTNTPHFIFHRLEYLLWYNFSQNNFSVIPAGKEKEIRERCDKFHFSFRNSVEHFKPQNSRFKNGEEAPEVLDDFGNLCLLSRSNNSKLSNETPYNKKQQQLKSGRVPSLKQLIMMAYINNESDEWNAKTIEDHRKKMTSLLNARIKN